VRLRTAARRKAGKRSAQGKLDEGEQHGETMVRASGRPVKEDWEKSGRCYNRRSFSAFSK
jgi:hypothetical protein